MFSGYNLADILPGEKVTTIVHRDFFVAIRRIIFFILLLAIPIVLIIMVNFLFPVLLERVWLWPVLLLSSSAYLLFIWLLFFFSLLDYALDIWIITNIRVIDVHQDGFFSRSTAEIRLEWIQDISSDSNGFFATIFRYGNLNVQTASEHNSLIFEQIPNPEHIRDLLMESVNKEESKKKTSS
jgi:uncharacterized membrane protein YdbT with pleckstrin-like domain